MKAEQAISEVGLKALVIVMDAHVHNLIEPGLYNERLNAVLKRNGVEGIKWPEGAPNSSVLVTSKLLDDSMKVREGIYREKRKRKESTSEEEGEIVVEEMEQEPTQEEEILERHLSRETSSKDALDLGISFMTDAIVVEGGIDAESVRDYFDLGKIKYKISQRSTIKPETVEQLIKEAKIHASSNTTITCNRETFKKIKNGISTSKGSSSKTPHNDQNKRRDST